MERNNVKNFWLTLSVSAITFGAAVAASRVSVFFQFLTLNALLVTVLVGRREAVFSTLMISIATLVFLNVTQTHDMLLKEGVAVAVHNAAALVVILLLKNPYYSRFRMVWGSMIPVMFAAVLAACASALLRINSGFEWSALVLDGAWTLAGGAVGIFFAIAIMPFYELVFKVWTNFKTAEMCSFHQPLLKELAEKAPGTFNHSLAVGNLAEACAVAIGENPFMARAAAYYHDIGKIDAPGFFAENQSGRNPHDDMIPEISVGMIKKHTSQGVERLRSVGMPEIIVSAANEHHGTTPVMFFYLKAQGMTEGKLKSDAYCYDAPKPRSKIAAIIMITDTIEAATRAAGIMDAETLDTFIYNIIMDKVSRGQFDECDITLKDLDKIRSVLKKAIPSIHHKRVQYQNQDELKEEK